MKFISDITFLLWPGKSVNLNFRKYQSYRNNDKFNFCLEIFGYLQPKPLNAASKSHSYLISLSRRCLVNPSTPTFPNINLTITIENLPVVSNVTEKWQQ